MKTKTEELLEETKKRMRSGSILFDELEQHLSPLIAKERIIAKLREYDAGEHKSVKKYAPFIDESNGVIGFRETISMLFVEKELLSTLEAWLALKEEMPETILEAFGWGGV